MISSASWLHEASNLRNCPRQQKLQCSILYKRISKPSLNVLEYGRKLSDKGYAPGLSTDSIAPDYLLKFVSCNCEGECSTLGVGVKSEGSSTFLLAGNAMVTLARTSNKQLIIVVRKISASRLARYQCYDID